MKCEQIREQLIETARGRGLSSDLRAVAFVHAAECENCSKQLDAQGKLTSALADLAWETDAAPARMEQLLRRELFGAPRQVNSKRAFGLFGCTLVGRAAAAAVGLAAGLAVVILGWPRPAHEPARVAGMAGRGGTEKAVLRPPGTQAAPAVSLVRRESRRLDVARRELADSSDAGFTQLPYAPELSPAESTDIVRVQLPRESLWAMGIPVSADGAGELIQADLLLGLDGTARAIRIDD